jgi:hypothetical protein
VERAIKLFGSASANQTIEGGDDTFWFGDFMSKSLVPHQENMNQKHNLKQVSSQPC